MEPSSRTPRMFAPGASSAAPLSCPGAADRLPRLDERAIPMEEDDRFEILDGEILSTMANLEHGKPQANLAAVLHAAAATGYTTATELTTRADTVPPPADWRPGVDPIPKTVQDLTSDACLVREGKDPRTGDRYLEELAFEVANEQSYGRLCRKAQRLSERGVRRVFGVLAKKGQVLEWDRARGEFRLLRQDEVIADPCLRVPLPIKAILDAAAADEAVARALDQKGIPYMRQLRQEGLAEGQRQALLTLLGARGFTVPEEVRARVLACADPADLTRWIARAATATTLQDVFGSAGA